MEHIRIPLNNTNKQLIFLFQTKNIENQDPKFKETFSMKKNNFLPSSQQQYNQSIT
jgi:hypothetical protein